MDGAPQGNSLVDVARLSGNQIDALGKRLRESPPTDEDLARLQQLLAEHLEALELVNQRMTALGLRPHGRLKSTDTIIEKLRREPISLRGIHDLAGTRVVKRMTLAEQDDLAARVSTMFPEARVIDRRAEPNNGYRAVHIVVRVNRRWVEIQLRTVYQDTWAQAMETLADFAGRQIRYGEPPDRSVLMPSGGPVGPFLNELVRLSDRLAEVEQAENDGVMPEEFSPRELIYQLRRRLDLPDVE